MAKGSFTECSKCGARVRREKLRRHMNNVHGKGRGARKKTAKQKVEAPQAKVAFPWRAFAALAVSGLVVVAAYWFLTRPQEGTGPPPSGNLPVAVMETNHGTIRIELDTGNAPITAGNFIGLARAGFYDGLTFHRLAANFVIQGGDPNGDGSGGSGTTVPWEDTGLQNLRYTIAMARSGDPDSAASKDTATSQFFLNLRDNPALDSYAYPFVVFGRVIEGQDVVNTIGALYPPGDTGYDGPPTQPVNILRVTIVG